MSLTVERLGDHTGGMEKFSLEARARVLMKSAATAPAGRAAETVYGGHEHVLRQTLIALTAGWCCRSTRIPARRPSRCWEDECGSLLTPPSGKAATATS